MILCGVGAGDIAGFGGHLIDQAGVPCFGWPLAAVFHVEPAPDLSIAVKRDDVPAYGLVMVPDRQFARLTDTRRGASLLAKVESSPISGSGSQIVHSGLLKTKCRPGRPGPGRRRKTIADNHVVIGKQTKGDLVEDPRLSSLSAMRHWRTTRIFIRAIVEPDPVATVAQETALLQDGVAAQHNLSPPASQPQSKLFRIVC